MKIGTRVKYKESKVLREIISMDNTHVVMDTLDENFERKILSSNNFSHRKSVSREYFDTKVSEKKILEVS